MTRMTDKQKLLDVADYIEGVMYSAEEALEIFAHDVASNPVRTLENSLSAFASAGVLYDGQRYLDAMRYYANKEEDNAFDNAMTALMHEIKVLSKPAHSTNAASNLLSQYRLQALVNLHDYMARVKANRA